MISVAPKMTDAGMNLLIRAIAGEQITFTRFKVGNGEMGATLQNTLTDLLNVVLDFPIDSADASYEGYISLSGTFYNRDIVSDFYWRELGVFARGEDGTEILYAYAYDEENASLLKKNTDDVVVEQSVSVVVAIGTAEHVTAVISHSAVYASKEALDSHTKNQANPHRVTAAQVGLGNVPNVPTNDQTPTWVLPDGAITRELTSGEKLSIALGKIARAILNFIAHLADQTNPHKVTAEQAGAAKSTHTHAATDINAGMLSIERGGTNASSAEQARTNLGAAKKSIATTLTVPVSAWEGEGPYTATLSCSVAKESNNLVVGAGGNLTTEQMEAMVAAVLVCTAQSSGKITLTAYGDVPTLDLPVNVLEVG